MFLHSGCTSKSLGEETGNNDYLRSKRESGRTEAGQEGLRDFLFTVHFFVLVELCIIFLCYLVKEGRGRSKAEKASAAAATTQQQQHLQSFETHSPKLGR